MHAETAHRAENRATNSAAFLFFHSAFALCSCIATTVRARAEEKERMRTDARENRKRGAPCCENGLRPVL